MRKTFGVLFIIVAGVCFIPSCSKQLDVILPPEKSPDYSFSEEFDDVPTAISKGWKVSNASDPLGNSDWMQKNNVSRWFAPFSGSGYIGTDYKSTSADSAIISNWLISPVTNMQNGDSIIFYTRALLLPYISGDSTDYANRLQVRINVTESTTVGKGIDSGDFTLKILDINPDYAEFHVDPGLSYPTAYPGSWTKFIVRVAGLSKAVKGRFAFRYFIEGGGSAAAGSGVGIDKVVYRTAPRP